MESSGGRSLGTIRNDDMFVVVTAGELGRKSDIGVIPFRMAKDVLPEFYTPVALTVG